MSTNAQVTIPGGLGLRRGPLGGGFSPGVGRGYQDDMAGSHWPRQVAVWASRWPTAMCLKKIIHYKYSHFYSFFYHNSSTSSIIISILFLKKNSHPTTIRKMNPHNRGFDPNNPWAYQETPSPPSNRPIAPFLIHSTMSDMAGYASFISNRLKNDVGRKHQCLSRNARH